MAFYTASRSDGVGKELSSSASADLDIRKNRKETMIIQKIVKRSYDGDDDATSDISNFLLLSR